jgi:hypothetical protein
MNNDLMHRINEDIIHHETPASVKEETEEMKLKAETVKVEPKLLFLTTDNIVISDGYCTDQTKVPASVGRPPANFGSLDNCPKTEAACRL